MMGKTHLAAGFIAGEAMCLAASATYLPTVATVIIASAIGSLLPDIDLPNSTIAKRNKVTKGVAKMTSSVLKHRGFTHTLPFLLIVCALTFYLSQKTPVDEFMATSGMIVGMFSHLFLDTLNEKGIMWLWPFSASRFHCAKIRTGSRKEKRFRCWLNVFATVGVIVLAYQQIPQEVIQPFIKEFTGQYPNVFHTVKYVHYIFPGRV